MKVTFSDDGWEDYLYWQAEDRKTLKRINQLIEDISRNGNEGIGKPEPVRHEWAGWWSQDNAGAPPRLPCSQRQRRDRGLQVPLR